MSTIDRIRGPLELNSNKKSIILFITLLSLCLFVKLTKANDNGESTVSERMRMYQFLADKSTIIQTGGIEGINRTYIVTGTFRLTTDFEAGKAFFGIVDAKAVYSSPVPPTRAGGRTSESYEIDPNEVFRMTELDGTIDDMNSIQLEGMADDGSSIQITLTLIDDSISLIGQILPPPDSADFFIYTLDALAEPKYEYGGGGGTSEDPYRIYTAEHMNAIGANPIDWNNHFMLMSDIDLAEFDGKDGRPAFNIIGTTFDFSFTGVFDGNYHEIYNFSHTSPYVFNMFYIEYVGLFGIVNGPNAKIRNLGFINPRIVDWTGSALGCLVGRLEYGNLTNCYTQGGSTEASSWDSYVGGLVGYNLGGTIINSHSTSTISNMNGSAGGLVGNNAGTIINCYSNNTIYGSSSVGGLVGSNYSGTVEKSYSTSVVTSGRGSNGVGGLVGYNGGGNINTSYSTGSVSGEKSVGGLVGDNGVTGNITMSYCAGLVSGSEFVGGLLGKGFLNYVTGCFWDKESSGQTTSAGGTGLTTIEMQEVNTYLMAGWDFVDERSNGTSDYWQILPGEYPQLYFHTGNKPVKPDGLGTKDKPYLIRDERDIGFVRSEPMAHYRLETSVDLSGITWSMAVIPWFGGIFDGNNHVISNLRIQGAGYLGLFGKLSSTGKVTNLGLEVVDVNATGSYVGGLVGWNFGEVTRCFSSGIVSGTSDYIGGLVGYNSARIIRSGSSSSVTGDEYVGGLVGKNTDNIDTSYSSGTIKGTGDDIGGLVGLNAYGNISTSYSAGLVNGTGYHIGGLVGLNNESNVIQCYSTCGVSGDVAVGGLVGWNYEGTVTRCYSTGEISGKQVIGGLIGSNFSLGTEVITSSFWDVETSGIPTGSKGTGKTTAEMQTASTFLEAGWDFVDETANGTEDIWWIDEGQDYPRLLWEAIE